MQHQQQLFRLRQAAEAANIAEATMRNWIKLGKGPRTLRMGKLIMIDRRALMEFLAGKEVAQ
jgi:hypothetical protein